MKKVLGFFILLALVFPQKYNLVDQVMAIVGNEIITLSDIKNYEQKVKKFLATKYKGKELEEIFQKERKNLLKNLIEKKLLLVKAKEEGITGEEDLKIALKNMAKQYGFSTVQELEAAMAKQGINVDEWKKDALENIIQQKLIQKEIDMNIHITEGEIRSYYEEHMSEFTTPEKWELKAIKVEDGPGANRKKIEIDRVIKEKGFEEAIKLSDPPFNTTGGSLGEVTREELREEFLKAVNGKGTGYITPWIETSDGWYRLEIVNYTPPKVKKLNDVRKKIENIILGQKRTERVKEFIKKLKNEIYVKVLRNYPE